MKQIIVYDNLLNNKKIPDSLKDLFKERYKKGLETYGCPLMTGDERDTLKDIKEEIADAIMYSHKFTLETGELEFDNLTKVLMNILEIL